jgi:CheY-like chemotaxis protein
MNSTHPVRKVLLADDNVDAADTLGAFLEMLGFQVRVVHSGTAALREAAAELPDVAILDLGMPGLDGWEVCRGIRNLPQGAKVRVVALSGWGSEEVRLKSQQAGFDAHWTKPAEAGTLIMMLRGEDPPA